MKEPGFRSLCTSSMRFDKFVSTLTPHVKVSNATMNMFFCVSLLNSLYYVVYPKFRDFRMLLNGDGGCIDECDSKYDITSKHIITLAWAIFFLCFSLVFNSAVSFIINVTSLSVAILSIMSIVVILNKRERVMFSEFGKPINVRGSI